MYRKKISMLSFHITDDCTNSPLWMNITTIWLIQVWSLKSWKRIVCGSNDLSPVDLESVWKTVIWFMLQPFYPWGTNLQCLNPELLRNKTTRNLSPGPDLLQGHCTTETNVFKTETKVS